MEKGKIKMKKIIVVISVGLVIILSMFLARNIFEMRNIEKNIQLSNEEKSELSYSELINDIKSLEKGKTLEHAKYVESEKKDPFNEKKYQGNGYYITREMVPDASIDTIYTNDNKEIYKRVKSTWSYDAKNKMKKENIFYICVILVSIVDLAICISIFIRNRKKIKESKK